MLLQSQTENPSSITFPSIDKAHASREQRLSFVNARKLAASLQRIDFASTVMPSLCRLLLRFAALWSILTKP